MGLLKRTYNYCLSATIPEDEKELYSWVVRCPYELDVTNDQLAFFSLILGAYSAAGVQFADRSCLIREGGTFCLAIVDRQGEMDGSFHVAILRTSTRSTSTLTLEVTALAIPSRSSNTREVFDAGFAKVRTVLEPCGFR